MGLATPPPPDRPEVWCPAMDKRALTIALVAAAATGCKKDDGRKGGGGDGRTTQTTTTTTTPTAPEGQTPAGTPRPSQMALPQLPELELPDDPRRADKVALGHALFFDPRMSVDGSRSCYSCHQNEDGNGGRDPVAIGPAGPLPRHSPVIWNVAFFKNSFYWDGRSPTLEAQALAAWEGGNMAVGAGNGDAKAAELAKIPGYQAMFEAAFPGQAPTADLVTQALAEYERTLICKDTAYDKFAAGDKAALSEPQQRGLDVFLGKGQCNVCHTPPFFSAAMNVDGGVYFNTGVGTQKPEAEVDVGRMKVTENEADWGAFKPPSLRNVTRSAPYFHDGSAATLDEVVAIMATGGIANPKLTPVMTDRKLTADEVADLTAFLSALDCPQTLEPPPLPE
jgi:cytochrome c peroxidase